MSETAKDIALGVGAASTGAALSYLATESWRRKAERTVLDGKPARATRVDAGALAVDADTFQFKSGGDTRGVTDRLAGVKSWNAAAAGKVMVYEYADGRRVIADGHQRLGLAQRLMSEGHAPIKMDAIVLKQQDGWQPRDVRAYAAIKNMHESSGHSVDMARVMRERPDLVTSSLPVSDAKVREARSLANLSDDAFRMVSSGAVEPGAAAAVGEAVREPARHVDMLREMSEAKVKSGQHARLYVEQAMAAPSISETTSSLFGDETQVRSLTKERATVLDRAMTALKGNKKLFSMLEREAATIEEAGNKLVHDTNAARADTAARLSTLVEKLATQRGTVSKMLDDAARAVAQGEPAAKAARGFMKSVQTTMEQGGIKALVGDGPLPLAASGGMQRMVEKPKDIEVGRTYISRRKGQYTVEKVENGKVHVDMGGTKFAYDERQFREQIMSNNQSRTGKTQSSFLPAATTKEQVAAAAKMVGKPAAVQQPMDDGLFGSGMKQMDLVDEARKAAYTPKTNAEIVAAASGSPAPSDARVDQLNRRVAALSNAELARAARGDEAGYEKAKQLYAKAQDQQLTAVAAKAQNPGWSDAAREASAEVRAADAKSDAPTPTKGKGSRKAKHDADMARIHQEIRDTLGPRGDGKHFHTDGTPITKATEAARAVPKPSAEAATARKLRAMTRGKSPADLASTLGNREVSAPGPMKAQAMSDAYGRLANRYGAGGADDKAAWAAGRRDKWGKVAKKADAPVKVADAVKHPGTPIPKPPAGWSDAAREGSAKSRGVALPGEAKAVVPAKAGKAKPPKAPKLTPEQIANRYFDYVSGQGKTNTAAEFEASLKGARNADIAEVARALGYQPPKTSAKKWLATQAKQGAMSRGRDVSLDAFDNAVTKGIGLDAAKRKVGAEYAGMRAEVLSKLGKKALGILGPVGIVGAGAIAFDATRNQAHAAGKSSTEANASAVAAGAMASGSIAAVGYGITKAVQGAAAIAPAAGRFLAKAVPAVAAIAAVYEAGKGAMEGYKDGGGIAGAAKGAAVGVADFATMGAYSHFTGKPGEGQQGRLSQAQQQTFAVSQANYEAAMQAAKPSEPQGGGWSDSARIAAYETRMNNAGQTAVNLPYGGVPRSGPVAAGATPEPKPARKKGGA